MQNFFLVCSLILLFQSCSRTQPSSSIKIESLSLKETNVDIDSLVKLANWNTEKPEIHHGYTSDTYVFRIHNPAANSQKLLVVKSNMAGLLPEITNLYFENQVWVKQEAGFAVPSYQKEKISPFGYFALSSSGEYSYVVIRSTGPIELHFSVIEKNEIERLEVQQTAMIFVWISVLLLSIVAGFFLFAAFRDPLYIVYAFYLIPFSGIYMAGYLFAYDILPHEFLEPYFILKRGLPFVTAALYLEMLRRFFNLNGTTSILNKLYLFIFYSFITGGFISFFIAKPEWQAYQLALCYVLLLVLALMGVVLTTMGRRTIVFFTLFWIYNFLLLGNRLFAIFGADTFYVVSVYGNSLNLIVELGIVAARVYYTLHPVRASAFSRSEVPIHESIVTGKKKKISRFPDHLEEQLDHAMTVQKVYLDDSLNLISLSAILQVKPYILSAFFSEVLNKNFNDYINTFRIEEAKILLEQSEMNITRAAYESGFNSRSAFYKWFKLKLGMNPQEYRDRF